MRDAFAKLNWKADEASYHLLSNLNWMHRGLLRNDCESQTQTVTARPGSSYQRILRESCRLPSWPIGVESSLHRDRADQVCQPRVENLHNLHTSSCYGRPSKHMQLPSLKACPRAWHRSLANGSHGPGKVKLRQFRNAWEKGAGKFTRHISPWKLQWTFRGWQLISLG